LLETVGVESTDFDDRIRITPPAIGQWLSWCGPPVPGVEYKWAKPLIVYRALRTDPQTAAEFRSAVCIAALEVARERTDLPLTQDTFNKRVDLLSAADVAETLGGGSWADALSVADITPQTVLARNLPPLLPLFNTIFRTIYISNRYWMEP